MKKLQPISLMRYKCAICEEEEIIWNSEPGYPPQVISCIHCGGNSLHMDELDVITPADYKPKNNRWVVYNSKESYRKTLDGIELSLFKNNKEDMIELLMSDYKPEENPIIISKIVEFE